MSLESIIGPMFSGKSSLLLSQVRRYKSIGYNCFIITHSSDSRYTSDGSVINHDRDHISAYPTDNLTSVLNIDDYKLAKSIFIDEAQFFSDLVSFVHHAVEVDNKNVVIVGLNGSATRQPIGHILELIPFCDTIKKMDALCAYCLNPTPAPFTLKKNKNDTEEFLVGGKDIYEACCRKHYMSKK